MVKTNIMVIGEKNFKENGRFVNYYLVLPNGSKLYLCTKPFTKNSYNLCKGGMRLNDLLSTKTRDHGIMRLVNYVNWMMPYFKQEYGLV